MIIGLIGRSGAGKTTLAQYIVNKYGHTEYAIAEPIKKMLSYCGFTREQLYGSQQQKLERNILNGWTAREAMRKLGDAGRSIRLESENENVQPMSISIWNNIAGENISKLLKQHDCVVVSDIRYSDEIEMLHRLFPNVYLVKIVRDGRGPVDHSSEDIDRLPYNFLIDNNRTEQDMFEIFDEIYSQMLDNNDPEI